MSDNVYVNADRTAVVEETDPGKKWQMRRKEAVRLGLLDDGDPKPQARRNVREDTERTFTTTGPATDAPKRAAKK